METITIQKSELKNIIRETMAEFFPKIEQISNTEMKEIDEKYKNIDFDKNINDADFIKL